MATKAVRLTVRLITRDEAVDFVRGFAIPPYILPGPLLVAETLVDDWGTLFPSLLVTLRITLEALAAATPEALAATPEVGPVLAACVVGLLSGLVLSQAHASVSQLGTGAGDATGHIVRFLIESLVGAVDAIVSCFLFAYAWLICIYHRDHYEEPGDDFDF